MRKPGTSTAALAVAAFLVSLPFVLAPGRAHAAAPSLIRDAEIEHTIRTYAAPLLHAAGMSKDDVGFHIVNSSELNAFVARGRQIFITTGLLMRAEHPGQVMGVVAHEIGHITGGHLARLEGAIRDAEENAMIINIIGIALGVLAKDGAVATAGGTAGTHIAQRSLMKYTRVQERSADQVALNLLNEAHLSPRGLYEFFEILGDQELLTAANQDPYAVTHPLTRDRIIFVENALKRSRWRDVTIAPALLEAHKRMVAKLEGFINPPAQTLGKYRETDRSVAARYARAVAFYRDARLEPALAIIDGLIADAPNDPYFHELRGQILFENGKLEDALPEYEAAVSARPHEPLLRTALAHVQIELNRPELTRRAIGNLEQATARDRYFPMAWRLAAIAYGRAGDLGLSALSLAEYNMLIGERKDAIGQAEKAMRLLKNGTPGWIRAQDIVTSAKSRQDEN